MSGYKTDPKAIEKTKKQLGEIFRDLADGVGALVIDENSSTSKCIDDFEEAAGELVYEFLKAVVLDGAGAWEEEGVPKFLVLDVEEDWASHVMTVYKGMKSK
ncbi:unnamed protein product [marine sediment metagenome]|uniref:Uncharacterized protein n=1 Tax=marine sediment metagenome TaxID=412755 RepID=X0VDC6_9ZZZZ